MKQLQNILEILIFPSGLFLIVLGLAYNWIDRKLVARYQNRIGPRWFQPAADLFKLLANEEIVPDGVNSFLFTALPMVGLAGALTAALYVPIGGVAAYSYPGDLIVTIFLLSLLTICLGLAGSITIDRFSLVGAVRTLTQLFCYEAPFLLALLGPAIVAGSWRISDIIAYASEHTWLFITQPIGFVIAMIGLMGKLELPPFDAPEAETEIVAGPLTEYSGRGLALFWLGKAIELVIGLTLIATFFLGGMSNLLVFFAKTIGLLLILAGLQSLFARLRIDQVVGLWWRYGAILVLAQFLVMIVWKGIF